jgi:superfamily I DNA/RNA helicase
MRCTKEGREKPKVYEYPSWAAQMKAIKSIIESKGFQDTGILFRTNDEVERAYKYFNEIGLQVEAKFDRNMQGTMNLDFTTDNPKLLTYWSAKGLQFEAVFIPDCSFEDDSIRNPLYVAMTRAYRELYIMHTGNLSGFFDNVPPEIYETNTGDDVDVVF